MIPPAAVLGAVLAGDLGGHALGPGTGGALLAASLGAGAGAVAVRGARGRALAAVALATLAAALTVRSLDGVRPAGDGPHAVAATVELVGDPRPGPFRTEAVVRLGGRHVLARAGRPWSSHLAVAEAGDRLRVVGDLHPLPPTEAARWRHRHVGGALDVRSVNGIDGRGSPLLAVAGVVRRVVLGGTSTLPSPERGLVTGFLVGDTRAVPDSVIDDFRAAGLSHLLAVSGANVATMLALLGPLLSPLGLRGRWVGTVGAVLVFAAVTRFEPSVLRASAMACLAATAWFAGRPAPGLRLLVISISGLLLVDPLLLGSLGFRLSCAASAGILLWGRRLAAALPGPRLVREPLAVTLAAQVAVAPFLLPTFGSIPVAAVPANLLAAPLTAPLTAWGFASGAVSALVQPWLPEAARLLQLPSLALARALRAVAAVGAGIPGSVDSTAAWGVASVSCAVASVHRWSRRVRGDGADPRARPASLRRHAPGGGDGHPQPDARLLL